LTCARRATLFPFHGQIQINWIYHAQNGA
jgi:hypothetical protein